jgi:hypothetical protein
MNTMAPVTRPCSERVARVGEGKLRELAERSVNQ